MLFLAVVLHNEAVIQALWEAFQHLFHPRHSNNHRARVLHPGWMVAFAIFAAIGLGGVLVLERYSTQIGFVLGYASNITVEQVVSLTNQERARSGLGSLTLNAQLSNAATAKANDMFQNQYWAHVSPQGKEPWSFISESGYKYRVAGENLARDFYQSPDMVRAWMDSPTHRANIMNSRYTEIGLAVVNGVLDGVETTLVVQMFGAPTTSQPQLAQSPPPQEVVPTQIAQPDRGPTINPETQESSGEPVLVAGLDQDVLPSPSVSAALPIGREIQLQQPRTAILSRQVFPSGLLMPLRHINPLTLIKSFFITILVVVVGALLYDLYAIKHYHSLRIVGKNLAHILFFAAVAFLLVFYKSGAIL